MFVFDGTIGDLRGGWFVGKVTAARNGSRVYTCYADEHYEKAVEVFIDGGHTCDFVSTELDGCFAKSFIRNVGLVKCM